jgi:prepilin-type N-terminal cleavage/methylation domain-containing protein/prepilin-type processing-associated H-X9-DG protein
MKTRQSGFTLLELLVVIAIISALAGLLFPAISRIQEKGRVATCVSNLRQLHTAAMSYVSEHDGYLPHAASEEYLWVDGDGDEHWGFHRGWVDWYPDWDSSNPPSLDQRITYWWNQNDSRGLASVRNGTLFRYVGDVGDEKVYVCPTMQKIAKKRFRGDSNRRDVVTRSYGMNASLQNDVHVKSYSSVGGPSRTILFAEQGFILQSAFRFALENTGGNIQDNAFPGKPNPGTSYILRSFRHFDGCIDWRGWQRNKPVGGGDWTWEHIGEYHDDRGNVVFCDGHVERIHYRGTRYICSGDWEEGKFFKSGSWHKRQELVNEGN